MLNTGIEVEARPAGKKVKRLSLLSGGERSLVAVAFLVSLFKARPSPFYILDEVEAALDDTNLGRLLEIYEELRENSQLLVITHQKRTMEVGDALYGVTMRGDGVSAVISQRLREPSPPDRRLGWSSVAPRRTRFIGVVALLLGAPVFAELIQSYLEITGELAETLFLIVFLAPLYGGAALLIREVAVRTGRGWPGRLLLAGAFGVLMPTWVDLSLWTPQTAEEIELWGDIRGITLAGVSVLALSSWALGHVVMSVAAPLVVVEALLPRGRGLPWLGWFGITVLTLLAVGVAALIHVDAKGAETSTSKFVLSLALAAALTVAAFTPLGRPLTPVRGEGPGVRRFWASQASS